MEQPPPKQLVFSCETDSFLAYDSEEVKSFIRHGSGRPLLALKVGKGNIFESAPKKVLRQTSTTVSVQCTDGSVVHLDIDDDTALKDTLQGKFRYSGSLDEGNSGHGYMRA